MSFPYAFCNMFPSPSIKLAVPIASVMLWLSCFGCSDTNNKPINNTRFMEAPDNSDSDRITANECRDNICIHLRVLSREEVQEQQKSNLQKLEVMYRNNKDFVGSSRLRQRYEKGSIVDSTQHKLRDILVTITASTIDTNATGHEYFEIAQKLETSIEEQACFSANGIEKAVPTVVRLYEIQPLQYTWQFLVTVPGNVVEHTHSVFHWNDQVFGTGAYSIAL